MQTHFFPAQARGLKDLGWLKSHLSFSFSDYKNPIQAGFGLLRVFNDDFVQPGGGFGIHPHANMEIISVLLKGKMNHIDSMGYSEEIEAGGVQIMSAGTGLRHEEHNIGTEEVNFLQIWIEPKLQNIPPRYQKRHFPKDQRQNQLSTIVSQAAGTAHCWINQDARLSLGFFEAGFSCPYQLEAAHKAVFVFNLSGQIQIGKQLLNARDGMGIWATDTLRVEILQTAEFILIEVPINH